MQHRHEPDPHLSEFLVPARRRWHELERRTRRRLMTLAALLVVAAALVAAVLTVPLPVSMIAPRMVQAVEERLGPGYDVSIGHAWIDHGGGRLGFRLAQFEIRDPAGNAVLRVPEAVIGLSGNFMLGSRVRATSIRLVEPHLTVRIEKDGAVSLAAAEGAPPLFHLPAGELPRGAPAQLFGLLAAADVTTDPDGPLASLQTIDIARAHLVVDDRRRGTIDRLEQVDIKLMRRDAGLLMSAVSSDPSDHWSVSATLSGAPGRPRDLALGFENLSLPRLVYETLRGKSPVTVTGTLFGHMALRIDPEGAVPHGEATVEVHGLRVTAPQEPDAAVALAVARVAARWDGVTKHLTLSGADFAGGTGSAHFVGDATPVPDQPESWDYHIVGSRIVLPAARPGAPVVPLDSVTIDGRLDREQPRLTVTSAVLKSPLVTASGHGTVEMGATEAQADIALETGRTSLGALLGLWPQPVAPGARHWLVHSVGAATVGGLTLAMKGPLHLGPTPPGEEPAVTLDADFADATMTLAPGLPPIAASAGHIAVRGHQLDARATTGIVHMGDQTIALKEGRFELPDIFATPSPGTLMLHGTGPLAAFGALVATQPLRHLAPAGLDLRRGSGAVDAVLTLRGPVSRDIHLDDFTADLDATVAGGAIDRLFGNHRLTAADLHLAIDHADAKLQGRGTFDGALVSLAAQGTRRPGGGFAKATINASFDPSKLHGIGNLGVRGPVSARVALPDLASLAGATVEADLTGAAATVPGILTKPAGSAGHLAFTIAHAASGHWLLQDFAFDAAPAALHGTVELDADGGFVGAKLPLFRLTAGDDVRLQIERAGGGYRIALRGGLLDTRPFLHEALANAGSTPGPDIELAAKVGTAVGYSGEAIAGLDLKLVRRGGRLASLSLAGNLGSKRIVGGSDPAHRRITVTTGDAGAALAFFGIYRRVRGGGLSLELGLQPGATPGILTIQDFGIAGEPAFDSVLAGDASQRVTRFTRMRARFRLAGGRLLIDDAAIWGPDIGATLDGNIDYVKDRLDVRGTFVPAYLVNNLFSRLPIIGRILGGGANEGLIGVTFQVAGSLEKPVLRVNPMSVVAPGFLRKLFEFREGEADLGAGRAPAASPEGDGAYPPAPAVDPTGPTAAGPPLPLARPSR